MNNVLALVNLGVNYEELSSVELYLYTYIIMTVQYIIITWLFRVKFALFAGFVGFISRLMIFFVIEVEEKEIFCFLGTVLIDLLFIFSIFMREVNERKSFIKLQKTVAYSKNLNHLLNKSLPQGILVLREDLKKDLYVNESFTKAFLADSSITIQKILATLTLHKTDLGNQEGLEEIFEGSKIGLP